MSASIRAVLLDLYGTLAFIPTDKYRATKESMAAVLHCDPVAFLQCWRTLTTDSCLGKLPTAEDRVRATLSLMRVTATDHDVREAATLETTLQEHCVQLLPGAVDALRGLREMSLRLALVSNTSPTTARVPQLLGIAPYFDATVLSFEVGIVKPDAQIYLIACRHLDVHPSECVFAGDGDSHELEGAQAAGMTAIKVGGSEDLALHVGGSASFDYAVESIAGLVPRVKILMSP